MILAPRPAHIPPSLAHCVRTHWCGGRPPMPVQHRTKADAASIKGKKQIVALYDKVLATMTAVFSVDAYRNAVNARLPADVPAITRTAAKCALRQREAKQLIERVRINGAREYSFRVLPQSQEEENE